MLKYEFEKSIERKNFPFAKILLTKSLADINQPKKNSELDNSKTLINSVKNGVSTSSWIETTLRR